MVNDYPVLKCVFPAPPILAYILPILGNRNLGNLLVHTSLTKPHQTHRTYQVIAVHVNPTDDANSVPPTQLQTSYKQNFLHYWRKM